MTNHPETQGTLVTQDTVRRQIFQRHGEHWSHKTQYEVKQFRDTGSIGHTRHSTKANNLETRETLAKEDTVRRQTIQRHREHWLYKTEYEGKQSRNTGNIGHTRHSTTTNHPETRGTLVTQDTVRGQPIKRHGEHWSRKTQYEDNQLGDTGNIDHKRHSTKTNNPETGGTLGTQDTVRRQTIQRHGEH